MRCDEVMSTLIRALRWLATGLLVAGTLGIVALLLLVRSLIAPAPGEWATTVSLGPLHAQAGVPSLVRLGTAAWLAPVLDGREFTTRLGPVRYHWLAREHTVALLCAPCRLPLPGPGAEHITVAQARVTLRHELGQLRGTAEIAQGFHSFQATWQGQLAATGLHLQVEAAEAPIARWYALWGSQVPETAWADIRGRLGMGVDIRLPEGHIKVLPTVSQFSVQGLGTAQLASAKTRCGRSAGLAADAWLTKAVIAAEDQRFYEHPGYDLQALQQASATNQRQDRVILGGSTLTQQVAKMLVTGDERTFSRKLRELLYATEMEQTLGKARILRLYLDNAPWGNGLCGAEAAAQHYFGRAARNLTPAQAVWLAAMLHNPSAEAQRWHDTGTINLARAQQIAQDVRGKRRSQRQQLVAALAEAPDWPAPAAAPTP